MLDRREATAIIRTSRQAGPHQAGDLFRKRDYAVEGAWESAEPLQHAALDSRCSEAAA